MARLTPEDVLAAVMDVMSGPWVWGQRDCCAAACEVFRRLHGIDPMADLRGVAATREEADRIVSAYGGMEAMAARKLAEAGLVATDDPQPGDLGLSPERPEGRVLCICIEPGRWAAKTARGFALLGPAERAWTLPS